MSSTKKTTPDETMTVSLRLKKSLVSDLDKLAAIENRTRANLIETLVIKALKEDAR
jgi:metal-responsive CopG/Arc/MetJ family transcriptional regulator